MTETPLCPSPYLFCSRSLQAKKDFTQNLHRQTITITHSSDSGSLHLPSLSFFLSGSAWILMVVLIRLEKSRRRRKNEQQGRGKRPARRGQLILSSETNDGTTIKNAIGNVFRIDFFHQNPHQNKVKEKTRKKKKLFFFFFDPNPQTFSRALKLLFKNPTSFCIFKIFSENSLCPSLLFFSFHFQ